MLVQWQGLSPDDATWEPLQDFRDLYPDIQLGDELFDDGSRIITTTRIKAVANLCCIGIAAQMYEAKPLSDDIIL